MKQDSPSPKLWAVVIAIWLACCVVVNAEAPATQPVPGIDAQLKATKLIDDLFKEDYAKAKTPEDRAALAKKLIDTGFETVSDPTSAFVLICKGRDIGIEIGDPSIVGNAVASLNHLFGVNELDQLVDVYQKIVKKPRTPQRYGELLQRVIGLTQQSVAEDRFDTAQQFADLSVAIAQRMSDPAKIRNTLAVAQEVRQTTAAYEQKRKAEEVLAATPSDPDANKAIGRYRCFFKGDWSGGLPYLARANDSLLRNVTDGETRGPQSTEDRVSLADLWMKYADQETGLAQRRVQQRAAKWYREALPDVTGLAKMRVEKALEKLPSDKDAASEEAKVDKPRAAPQTPNPQSARGGEGNQLRNLATRNPAVTEVFNLVPLPLVAGEDIKEEKMHALGWRMVPDELKGAFIFSGAVGDHNGIADFKVIRDGIVGLACNWDYEGNSGGGWQESRLTRDQFVEKGWEPCSEMISTQNRQYTVFRKVVKAGEAYRLRCNKYKPPYVIVFAPGSRLGLVSAPVTARPQTRPAAADGNAAAPTPTPEHPTRQTAEVTIQSNSEVGYDLGSIKKGEKLTFHYIKGSWKGWGRLTDINPDGTGERGGLRCRLAIAEADSQGKTTIIMLVPEGTIALPFTFKAEKDFARLVLRMNDDDNNWNDNHGVVTYQITRNR